MSLILANQAHKRKVKLKECSEWCQAKRQAMLGEEMAAGFCLLDKLAVIAYINRRAKNLRSFAKSFLTCVLSNFVDFFHSIENENSPPKL